ncbi:MAG: hypothetical protein A3G41_07340 [Elusimicrobia bacterium RIFCSPLOWO2_12_FULL_59_9]|nr:MAG: hypothetical protein A3G41_07340 [Elusimicrobia bacterium RIFCSPLOWO2_12_FULL_59_9]
MGNETESKSRLEVLLEVGKLLSGKLDLADLLRAVIHLATKVAQAERASLLLLDPETRELYFDVALGLPEETAKTRLKIGQGIAGAAAKSGEPLIINDVAKDPRWSPDIDQKSGFKTRSLVAVPMIIKGRVVGVLEALNRLGGGPFTEEDVDILASFASQSAVAIENARLFSSLQEEKNKLQMVFTNMKEGAVLTHTNGQIVLINSAARTLLGLTASLPTQIQEFLNPLVGEVGVGQILNSLKKEMSFEIIRQRPKKLIVNCAVNAIAVQKEGPARGLLWVFRDVTAEKREEKLKQNFLSLISHKLKTPLSSITGFSHLLLEDVEGAAGAKALESQKKALHIINEQGKKLALLVQKLLDFTRMEEMEVGDLKRSHTEIEVMIKRLLEKLEPGWKGKSVQVVLSPSLKQKVFADADLLEEVLGNLLENAVKFNLKPEKRVSVSCALQGPWVHVRVSDNGPGIPPEEKDKIVEKFYQIEETFTGQVEGWGLGLAFVKKVLEKHMGALDVESMVDRGTTVTIKLPLVEEESGRSSGVPEI